jgi:hypothetical protein
VTPYPGRLEALDCGNGVVLAHAVFINESAETSAFMVIQMLTSQDQAAADTIVNSLVFPANA